jgi:hypothetical protein
MQDTSFIVLDVFVKIGRHPWTISSSRQRELALECTSPHSNEGGKDVSDGQADGQRSTPSQERLLQCQSQAEERRNRSMARLDEIVLP